MAGRGLPDRHRGARLDVAETRQRALDKLGQFTPKVGYPDRWRDYSALVIEPDDLLGNVRRCDAFETDRNLAKLGGPIDRDEWHMTPRRSTPTTTPA